MLSDTTLLVIEREQMAATDVAGRQQGLLPTPSLSTSWAYGRGRMHENGNLEKRSCTGAGFGVFGELSEAASSIIAFNTKYSEAAVLKETQQTSTSALSGQM